MHSPSAHRTLRPGQKLFANESNLRLAYMRIINQIRLTINHSGLFYTLETVKSPFKVKHFVNFANFSVNFGLFLLRFFTVCQFFRSLPCPAHKAKASALRRPGRIADAFLSRSISPQQKDLLCRPACEPRCADVVLLVGVEFHFRRDVLAGGQREHHLCPGAAARSPGPPQKAGLYQPTKRPSHSGKAASYL